MYPGLGHIPMEEAPERVLADLRAFLSGNASNSEELPLREEGSRRASV
jgi:hypothetical protein